MIEKQFWEEVKGVWIVPAPPKIKVIKAESGGPIDPTLLKDPWELEEVAFDLFDNDGTVQEELQELPKPERPKLDTEKFDELLEKQTLLDYVQACKLLLQCDLPEHMNELYTTLTERLPVLQDAVAKFEGIYQTDLSQFYEYYIPEALQLTASYLEYLDAGIDESIIQETEKEVLDAANKLLIAVNDKVDEVYKFASMEIKAKAKALESLMSQDGYVDSDFKIN